MKAWTVLPEELKAISDTRMAVPTAVETAVLTAETAVTTTVEPAVETAVATAVETAGRLHACPDGLEQDRARAASLTDHKIVSSEARS